MSFDKNFIASALSHYECINTIPCHDPSFSIDTRTLQKGDIFVALQGTQTDGHAYIAHALEKGAAGIIIAREKKSCIDSLKKQLESVFILIVDSPEDAFLKLAHAWRSQFSYPVVGVTGSVGKTSTKEMIGAILSTANIPHIVSQANQNTPLGLALNIFKMRAHHQIAVFEVGISVRGEMKLLAQILKPTTGIITCIGHAHMQGLGSLTDIAHEKRNLFAYLDEGMVGIINGDQHLLSGYAYAHPVIKFGTKTNNQVQARKISYSSDGAKFTLKLYKEKYTITLNKAHEGAVFNSLAAAAVCYLLHVPGHMIVKGLETYNGCAHRFEEKKLVKYKGTLIDDAYNANPESMKASLLAFEHVHVSGKKIAILGDMYELGANSAFWHRQLGRFLRKVPSLDHVILVGKEVAWTQKTLPVTLGVDHVATWQEAVTVLEKYADSSCTIFVKGSRGVALDKLVSHVTES